MIKIQKDKTKVVEIINLKLCFLSKSTLIIPKCLSLFLPFSLVLMYLISITYHLLLLYFITVLMSLSRPIYIFSSDSKGSSEAEAMYLFSRYSLPEVTDFIPYMPCLITDILHCVCVCAKSLPSCPTLCNPVDCNLLGCSVHGILQARILEWLTMPSSRDLPDPRTKPASLLSLALAGNATIYR